MPTNKQRREAERKRLQRQLEERRQRELARRRFTLIASIVGTLAVIVVVVVIVVATTGGSDSSKKPAAGASKAPTAAPTSSAAAQCGAKQFAKKKVSAARGASVSFDGVTVKGARDLSGQPGITSHSTKAPTKLMVKDLVVGKGAAAGPTSCATVQYDGVLYKTGKEFDSSWSRGQLAQFPLTGVVPGFTQGIGGTTGIPPMRIGGRRLIIMPAALGYGAKGGGSVPPNAPLVFVVDLTSLTV